MLPRAFPPTSSTKTTAGLQIAGLGFDLGEAFRRTNAIEIQVGIIFAELVELARKPGTAQTFEGKADVQHSAKHVGDNRAVIAIGVRILGGLRPSASIEGQRIGNGNCGLLALA